MQSEIPNDVMNAAKKCAGEWNLIDAIARAILDERARCKAGFSAAERMKPVLWANPEHMPKGNYLDAACPCQPNEGGSFTLPLYAAPPAPSVVVKALEWKRNGWVEAFSQPDGLGVWYSISPRKPVHGPGEAPFSCRVIWGVPNQTEGRYLGEDFQSVEEAKAAAQADYEARIRSALSAQVHDVAVAEIVSKYGDPEAFGERELIPLVDIQKYPYGTKLYAAAPSKQEGGHVTSK